MKIQQLLAGLITGLIIAVLIVFLVFISIASRDCSIAGGVYLAHEGVCVKSIEVIKP